MATASKNLASLAPDPAIGEIRYLLRGVGWEGYESLLEWLGDDAPRLTCWDGDVEFMSPLFEHGKYDALIAYMINQIVDQFDLPAETFTSITLRRGSVRGGLEPDSSFYFANAHRVRFGEKIDLDVDPPPDLCIEIEITNALLPKLEVYARLGIPEIWRFDGESLSVLILNDDRRYITASRSVSLPFVPTEEIERQLREYVPGQETAWRRRFRAWVRDVLVPLHRDNPQGE